jgi:two-component system, OmpR family, phosphate regulon response regulator PhoB
MIPPQVAWPRAEYRGVPSILVVDDDADIRDMLRFKLANAGFDVHAEEDGETGLAAARDLKPDLILLDWMMPRLTGPEVCRELRSEPATERVPVILLTAKAQEADVQRGFAAGADDYIAKPFSPRELLSRVQALLARAG